MVVGGEAKGNDYSEDVLACAVAAPRDGARNAREAEVDKKHDNLDLLDPLDTGGVVNQPHVVNLKF